MYIKNVIVLAELNDGTIHQVALNKEMENTISMALVNMFPDTIEVLENEILGIKVEHKPKIEKNGSKRKSE